MSGLDSGVDVLREEGIRPNSRSSKGLQADFWRWRREYPGEPYWVHFQTTDVHVLRTQRAPFAGLFVDDPERNYILSRGLYDERMAYQDDQIGRLVKRLKAEGELGHTLFIVAADHSSGAAGLMPPDSMPSHRDRTNLASYVSHIPMIIVWPDKIKPGQRFGQPVSLIDLLPTILDLAGLPELDPTQGHSFGPLLLGEGGWTQRPVILDEFNVRPDTGEVYGTIDVIDGMWGASLKIGKALWEETEKPENLRPAPLLLYDLWSDPQCLRSLHGGCPELVNKYTKFLEDKLKEHRSLAKKFSRAAEVPLNPEQIETLRSLGYIR
jgi:arylsulfatase A-like enzyme